MTWNGRVNVHDDLSRLHSSLRAADTSREIGYSSVTEGEGSLDLLTESGDVRASLGDQPDGRFGVSITHRGSLRFLPDLFTDLEDEDDSLSSRISGLGDRMVSAEGRLDGHDTTLGQHGSRLDGHDSTLSSHNTRITNAQSRADAAHSNAATAQSAAEAADSRLTSEASRLDGRITNTWDRATTGWTYALKIIGCINALPSGSARMMSTASIQPMAEADVWQQLKTCLAS